MKTGAKNVTVKTSNTGVGVVGLLGVAFVVLKLTGYLDWSWWWVTLPFWGGAAVAVFACVVVLVALMFETWLDYRRTAKRRAAKRGQS